MKCGATPEQKRRLQSTAEAIIDGEFQAVGCKRGGSVDGAVGGDAAIGLPDSVDFARSHACVRCRKGGKIDGGAGISIRQHGSKRCVVGCSTETEFRVVGPEESNELLMNATTARRSAEHGD